MTRAETLLVALLEATPEVPPELDDPDQLIAAGEALFERRRPLLAELAQVMPGGLPPEARAQLDALVGRSHAWANQMEAAKRAVGARMIAARRLARAAGQQP
jgi:hypothetical protein